MYNIIYKIKIVPTNKCKYYLKYYYNGVSVNLINL